MVFFFLATFAQFLLSSLHILLTYFFSLGMECQGCKKIPTGARDNTDKLKYRWIFHPELFNAMNGRGQVGTNLWHFVAYSRLCHIFHNESLHIAVPRQTKTDEYRKLIKRGDSNATFRPLKQLIAGSELFSGLLQAVIQSLTPVTKALLFC